MMMEDDPDAKQPKRRRIHMNCCDVEAYANTEAGAEALTHPSNVPKTSRDTNRGLYPGAPREKHRGRGHVQRNASETAEPTGLENQDEDLNVSIPVECEPVHGRLDGVDGNEAGASIGRCHQHNPVDQVQLVVPKKEKVNNFGFVSARSLLDPFSGLQKTDQNANKKPLPADPDIEMKLKIKSPIKSSTQSSPNKITWGSRNKKMVGFGQSNKMNSYFKPAATSDGKTLSLDQPASVHGVAVSSSSSALNTSLDVHRGTFTALNTSIDLTQEPDEVLRIPSQTNFLKREHGANASFFLKRQPSKSKSKKSKKKTPMPTFNRSNPFLYSGLPSQLLKDKEVATSKESKAVEDSTEISDQYGLLGTGTGSISCDDDENEEISWFSELPLEVIENIFCRVPLMDLCLNLTRVCKGWNDIISEPKFVQWKKTYFRILRGDEQCRISLLETMRENGMDIGKPETVLPGMIGYMKNFKRVSSPNMDTCLQTHPKHSWVETLFNERLPEGLHDGVPHPWCTVTALVILSENVGDVQRILGCLLGVQSQCTATEVLECLYNIASFLLVLKSFKYRDVWTGLHYRVYYALYLFENDCSATCDQLSKAFSHTAGGQQTILKYGTSDASVRYTNEQLRICNHNVGPNEFLKIVAFAGTGKTTTLIRYTQLRPQLKFLLVIYNKSVKEHCAKRFPKNVTCKTSHGLAMSHKVARRYGHKIGNFRVSGIADALEARKGENLYVQAKFVIDTITAFMASADREIQLSHVPMESTNEKGVKIFMGTDRRELLAEDARMIWERATNPRDLDIRLPHDGYLKVFQLSDPVIEDYNIILIDEAQDLTPAVIDVILRQTQPKILVGDPNQQIYSFRGAVNAMDIVNATSTYFLTQSFRFGSEIAFVANCCLELLKGEKKKVLVGNKTKGSIDGDPCGQLAIITRSNFTLFAEAVKKCCYSNEKIKVAFAGGVKDFGFDILQDMYALLLSEEDRKKDRHVITHPLIKKFRTLPDLEKFATKTHDNEMLGKIKIVKTYQHQLPSLVSKILSMCINDQGLADVVLSTAHKAKGLEFPTVRVADDFVQNFVPAEARAPNASTNASSEADEYNLLYVAVTRAKKALQLSPTIMRVLDYSGERFRYPRLTKDLGGDSPDLTCLLTEEKFVPCGITLHRKPVKLGDGQAVEAGYYSPQTVYEDLLSVRKLYGSLEDKREVGERRTHRVNSEHDWAPPWLAYRGWTIDIMDGVDFEDD